MSENMDANDAWLRDTDDAIDWLCRELSDWLAKFQHRPEVLVTLAVAMDGPQESSDQDTPFKHFAEALAKFLKKGYRDPRFIFSVLLHLQGRRLRSKRAGMWTTARSPRPTYTFESSRPPTPTYSPCQVEDINQWQQRCEEGQAPGYTQEDGSISHTEVSFSIPEHILRMREEEKRLQEEEKHKREQKILREQAEFREQEKLREPERLQELARLEERLKRLESQERSVLPADEPVLATAEHALERPARPRRRQQPRQSGTCPADHSSKMNGLRPTHSSKVTKTKAPHQVKRARRQRAGQTTHPPRQPACDAGVGSRQ